MFLICSKDHFISGKIGTLLVSKYNFLTLNATETYFEKITIEHNKNILKLVFWNGKNIDLILPLNIGELFQKLYSTLNEYYIHYDSFSYNPTTQVVKKDKLDVKLGNIHNIILSKLLLFQSRSLTKETLYAYVWYDDKSININKLDTHLTNLKNHLEVCLNLNLNIRSSKGNIALYLD